MPGLLDRHRGRVAVATAFLAHSLIAGSWASRIPAIKHNLGLSDGRLGVALFGMAAGTLIGGRLGGIVAARVGAWVVVRLGIPVFAATLVVAALVGNLAALTATMVVFGIEAAMVDVAMNAEAVVVERTAARPLMSSFHGMWSLGLLGGALAGVLAAAAGARPVAQFGIVAAAVAAGSAPTLARLPHRAAHARAAPGTRDAWSLPLVVLGLIAFASFLRPDRGTASSASPRRCSRTDSAPGPSGTWHPSATSAPRTDWCSWRLAYAVRSWRAGTARTAVTWIEHGLHIVVLGPAGSFDGTRAVAAARALAQANAR